MGEQQFRALSAILNSIEPVFDEPVFLATAFDGLEHLTLMERVRRASGAIDAGSRGLRGGYDAVLALLMQAAPLLGKGFVSLVAPDYVGQYGRHAFERSMDALKYFTRFGSSEFAVREFLRDDTHCALAIMETWSTDSDEAVRRLASEGSRPRLPWSFRLGDIEGDPSLAAPILDSLSADPSAYVRKSVANHLNDVTKMHAAWVLERVGQWDGDNHHTRWIVRHGLRTLVKQGNMQALAILGAGGAPEIVLEAFSVTPQRIVIGDTITLSCKLSSAVKAAQRLVVDYRIRYVKRSGATAARVFKLKELTLEPCQHISLSHTQHIRDFTTRTHYAGRHVVELIVNGDVVANSFFHLV
ncbi:3-methyladenine DNA glycosylase AlkC [Paraburkholderia sp. GAS448]